jgi:hypothetical protein
MSSGVSCSSRSRRSLIHPNVFPLTWFSTRKQ